MASIALPVGQTCIGVLKIGTIFYGLLSKNFRHFGVLLKTRLLNNAVQLTKVNVVLYITIELILQVAIKYSMTNFISGNLIKYFCRNGKKRAVFHEIVVKTYIFDGEKKRLFLHVEKALFPFNVNNQTTDRPKNVLYFMKKKLRKCLPKTYLFFPFLFFPSIHFFIILFDPNLVSYNKA